MSNQGDLFDNTSIQTNLDPKLAELVGEGKKYSSIEKLAASAADAQIHIANIEKERDELREDLNKRESMNDILERVTNSTVKEDAVQETPSDKSNLPQEDITSLVKDQVSTLLNQSKEQENKASNREAVVNHLEKVYGDKALDVLTRKSSELGMTMEGMTALAETSPAAVLAYFNNSSDTSSQNRVESSFNTSSTNKTSQVTPGTSAYYSQLRKEDPRKYLSSKVQLEMVNKAKELGSAFYQ